MPRAWRQRSADDPCSEDRERAPRSQHRRKLTRWMNTLSFSRCMRCCVSLSTRSRSSSTRLQQVVRKCGEMGGGASGGSRRSLRSSPRAAARPTAAPLCQPTCGAG